MASSEEGAERGPYRIAVHGAAGRMGRQIVRVVAETEGVELAAALGRTPGDGGRGGATGGLAEDAGVVAGLSPLGVRLGAEPADVEEALRRCDVMIDFSTPAASARLALHAAESGTPLVVGTTGLDAAERRALERAAERIPVVFAPNMSVGVNVLLGLLGLAAEALGEDFDVEIVELHHRLKRDAPSGTALRMAEVLTRAQGRDLARAGRYGRHGDVGPRGAEELGVLAVRGGDVVGEHTAYFLGLGERVEITHRATSRETFARGAVRAALWLRERDPGLYDMQDVLGLAR